MSDNTPIYNLTISARATLDLHSLNNEGGEGNQIQTRMVNIVAQDGRLHNVNAISGDMWKHIQAEHLHRLASEFDGVPLCKGCQTFNANRINADPDFQALLGETITTKVQSGKNKGKNKKISKYSDVDALDYILQQCCIDDIEGILVTSQGKKADQETQEDATSETGDEDEESGRSKKRSLPRKSVVEFGWVVGLPDLTTTDSYFHVKYANERGEEQRQRDATATESQGSNLGQAIFHRPASSGVYAVVVSLEAARIGFNDITQTYAIDEEQRLTRYQLLMESLLYTFLEPRGAMRSTQNPHLVNFEGVIAVSKGATPAPTVSPLKDNYMTEIEAIQQSLEPLRPGVVSVDRFESLGQFAEKMTSRIGSSTPYTLQYRRS